jgi:Glycosyltransferase
MTMRDTEDTLFRHNAGLDAPKTGAGGAIPDSAVADGLLPDAPPLSAASSVAPPAPLPEGPEDWEEEAEYSGPSLFLVHFEQYSANHEQTLTLAGALRDEGWDVHLVCRASCRIAPAAETASLPVHILPDTAGRGFFTAWKLARLIRKQTRKPVRRSGGKGRKKAEERKILVHACDPLASQVVADVWRRDKKIRIVHTRRVPIMEANSKSVRCYQAPPAKIITDSLAGKIALRLSGVETHLLHTIACGFDPTEQPARRDRADNRIVFAMIGDLVPERGHSLLFDALVVLENIPDLPPWEVRILGEGPYFPALLEEAQARNVAGHLAFLGGTNVPAQLAGCDALVLPAAAGESHMPLILRGWAAYLPLIATNRLDHAENLQDEANCLLVQPDDTAGLAARMARLAGDAALRSHLVAGGASSLSRYTVQTMVLEHKRLYGQILA